MELNEFWNEINTKDKAADETITVVDEPRDYIPVIARILQPLLRRVKMYLYVSYILVIAGAVYLSTLYQKQEAFYVMTLIEILVIGLTYNTLRMAKNLEKNTVSLDQEVKNAASDLLSLLKEYISSEKKLAYISSPIAYVLSIILQNLLDNKSLKELLQINMNFWVNIVGFILTMTAIFYFINWFYRVNYSAYMSKLMKLVSEMHENE